MKKLFALLLVLVLALSCTAMAAEKNKIVLSTMITGSAAEYGKMIKNGASLALKKFNEKNGTDYVMDIFDDKNDATEAVNIAALVLDDPTVMAVVPSYSGTTLATAQMYQDEGLLCYSAAGSNADIPGVGDLVFSIAISQKYEGTVFADALVEAMGTTGKLAVLYQATDQAYQNANLVAEQFVALGGEKVYMEMFEAGTTDYSPMLSSIKESGATVLFVGGEYADAANCFLQAQALEMDIQLVASGNSACAAFLDVIGSQANGCYVLSTIPSFSEATLASMKNASEDMLQFAADFQAEYGEAADGYAAQAYDAITIILTAAKETGSTDSADLAAYIASIKGYNGVSGFDMQYNDQKELTKSAIVFEVQDGEFLQVYP